MKIKMPPSVNMVIDSLHAKGFEAYAVGGCVRDTILAREPDDWDITTSASPQQVKEIFDRTVDTGKDCIFLPFRVRSPPPGRLFP